MELEAQVLDADYMVEDGEVAVRVFARSRDGEDYLIRDAEFKPYLYIVPEEGLEELRETIEEERPFREDEDELPILEIEEKEMIDGKEEVKVLKVSTNIPANVPKLKNKFWDLEETKECREFDIPFYRRYMMDKGLRPNQWHRFSGESFEPQDMEKGLEVESIEEEEQGSPDWNMLAFDLEVYENEIIMASLYSEDYEKLLTTEEIDEEYVEVVESEKELIERFVEIVNERNVDILTGYNTDEFDFDVLRDGSNRHNMTLSLGRNGERMKFNQRGRFKGARLKGRMHLDLYPFIEHVLAPGIDSETLDLDSVAEEMLGRNKDEMSWEDMKKSWENKENLSEFAQYALKDAELALELAQEIVPQVTELSRITGLIPFDTCRLTYGQLTENFLIREAHLRDLLAENRPSQDSRRKRQRQGAYSGGFVYTPEEGLYEDIVTLDFRSLYPTVMVAHNISPDTLNIEDCRDQFEIEEFDYRFCQDKQGFFPELIEGLVDDRYTIKEEMKEEEKGSADYKALDNEQQAKKILANSVGPHTYLVLEDPGGKIVVKSIKNFYSSLGAEEKPVRGSNVKDVGGWRALSVEGDKAVFKPVYAVSQHEPDDAYRVRTRMGEVTVTGDHSLISMKGESSNRIRDSSFDGLEEVKGSEVAEDDVIAQVKDLELKESQQEVVVPEVLKDCPEDFCLYIPKSENLEKRNWYERRKDLIEAVEDGKNSSDINSSDSFGNKVLAKAREEGLVRKVETVGDQGNIYECEVTEKGREYREFYDTFQKREKTSSHYVIPLEELEELPPREILEKSSVANRSGRARNKIPAVIELDQEFASLLGWFVAEGHFRKDGKENEDYTDSAIASDNPEHREEVQGLFREVFDYDASINGRQVSCCTSTIARLLSRLCGDKAENKKVPAPIFNSERPVREAFLKSYSLGDGDEDGRRFSTISKKLQAGLSTLLKEQDTVLHNGFDTETYRVSKRSRTQGQKIVSGDLYGQNPIEIEQIEKPEKVYDISVEDTEKFVTAEGLVLHNSFYGYLGYNGARWYSREAAEATTYMGREYIEETIEMAEAEGYEIVYGDTDSVFLKKDNIKEDVHGFLDKVNSELPKFMELEFEGFFKRGFFTSKDSGEGAKKKYALIDEEGNMKITGFEQVRRDWSPIAKRTQKEVLRKVLEDDVDEAFEVAKERIEQLKQGEIPIEDLKIYTTLTKPPEEYESTSPHVEAAKKAKQRGEEIQEESTITYVITSTGHSISDRAEILEYAEDYDADYYIENQVIPAALRVLKVFGYTEDQLKGKGKQSGLGRFQ
ncbi:MAG: DNA polymerase domain-containing protein [Candidatus Nanohalobium sp.]